MRGRSDDRGDRGEGFVFTEVHVMLNLLFGNNSEEMIEGTGGGVHVHVMLASTFLSSLLFRNNSETSQATHKYTLTGVIWGDREGVCALGMLTCISKLVVVL